MKKNKSYHHKTISQGHKLSPETQMMSFGYDPKLSEYALKPPIFMTSTFVFENAEHGKNFFELAYGKRDPNPGEEMGLIYSRINNPDLEVLEDRLALWEEAKKALTFSSGMSAIATTLLSLLRPGDVIVHSEPLYGGSEFFIRNILREFGIKSVEFESGFDKLTLSPALEKAKKLGKVTAIFVETPANPTNGLVDLAECKRLADEISGAQNGCRPTIIVDNTFLGPVWQQVLKLGADISIYSLTKFVSGHSDVIAGAVMGSSDLMNTIMSFRTILGTMLDPHSGWLIMRSLETLKLRMERSAQNTQVIADYLRQHKKIKKVHYLNFLPDHSLAKDIFTRQATSAGSTFSFEVKGDQQQAFMLLDNLKVIKLAVSLGGTESLMEHPFSMTHADVPEKTKNRLGITESMLRISVGIEYVDDLVADLEQALARVLSKTTAT
jgi:methionine-gamma-lyase